MLWKRGKRASVTGILFNKGSFDKIGSIVDEKIKYIELLFYGTGQVRHDLDYLESTGPIYIRTGPNSSQTEEVSALSRYIHEELIHLKRACKETEHLEEGVRVDQDDQPAKQDKELRVGNIKKVMAELENASKTLTQC